MPENVKVFVYLTKYGLGGVHLINMYEGVENYMGLVDKNWSLDLADFMGHLQKRVA